MSVPPPPPSDDVPPPPPEDDSEEDEFEVQVRGKPPPIAGRRGSATLKILEHAQRGSHGDASPASPTTPKRVQIDESSLEHNGDGNGNGAHPAPGHKKTLSSARNCEVSGCRTPAVGGKSRCIYHGLKEDHEDDEFLAALPPPKARGESRARAPSLLSEDSDKEDAWEDSLLTTSRPSAPTRTSGQSQDDVGGKKIQCSTSACLAFAVREGFCLRHVWHAEIEPYRPPDVTQYKIAEEIVSTEISYMEGISTASHIFRDRLLWLVKLERPIIPEETVHTIFHDIDELARLSKAICSDFEEIKYRGRILVEQVAVTLLHYTPQFRLFQSYLENYDRAQKCLAESRNSNEQLHAFLELNEKCEGATLESLLIMPIQRLPRYLLLLAELMKRTSAQDPVIADMKEAHERIGQVATHINQSLHTKVDVDRLAELEELFEKDDRYVAISIPGRRIIRTGNLKKQYRNSHHLAKTKTYIFFLFSDMLLYATSGALGKTYSTKHALPLKGMTVEPQDKKMILVTSKQADKDKEKSALLLLCESEKERQEWLDDLSVAIRSVPMGLDPSQSPHPPGHVRSKSSKALKML